MTDSQNPYTNLPDSAFWKTAVASHESMDIDLSWKPAFPVTRQSKILTVGSCFAQHISTSLKKNGFNWLDSEPAPKDLPVNEHAVNHYGVFSFRTGNIYTAALLRQWVSWACGADQNSDYVEENQRFFDPFRPSLNEHGFATAQAMLAARQQTCDSIFKSIKQADIFIFTLGLTEAWLNKNGLVYPMCPGTLRGTFSQADHFFHNYDHSEIVQDLNYVFDELRKINPELKFLLTVSPVPLTATAAGEHVLTATTYSKSVLRSAAGWLSKNRPDTDYFPSYEIISAPVFKGQFFERNQRSVTEQGVAFVMHQFLKGIGIEAALPEFALAAASDLAQLSSSTTSGSARAENEMCDEIILESWINKTPGHTDEPPGLILIGDSHMGMVGTILEEKGFPYAGGATMNASDWQAMRFDLSPDLLFVPRNDEQKKRWKATYQSSFARHAKNATTGLIITNVGQQRNEVYFRGFLAECVPNIYGPTFNGTVKLDDLYAYLMQARKIHIGLICRMLAMGHTVLAITDPPLEYEKDTPGCSTVDAFLTDFYKSIGCLTFNAREWLAKSGSVPDHYRSPDDGLHGSIEYYRDLTNEIFSRFSKNIKSQTVS